MSSKLEKDFTDSKLFKGIVFFVMVVVILVTSIVVGRNFYYYSQLMISLIGVIAGFVVLLRLPRVFKAKKKKNILYHIAILLVGVYFLFGEAIPLVRDLPSMVTSEYLTVEGYVEDIQEYGTSKWGKDTYVYIGDMEFRVSQHMSLEINKKYRLCYLPYTKIGVKAELIDD